jgi:hypothetical protein
MGELRPQSAVPNVNVTLATLSQKKYSPAGTWFGHIFQGQARIFIFKLRVPGLYYVCGVAEHEGRHVLWS